jgi:K(+)-stimulated pyrophosphate-energized sodium pump
MADLVGDNVGDCARRGADLFESTVAENIGAMILGIALWRATGNMGWVIFPLILRPFGIVASMIGILSAQMKGNSADPMVALNRGFYFSAGVSVLFVALSTYLMMGEVWYYFFGAGVIGLLTAFAVLYITQYYTETKYGPVKRISKASETGAATNVISGFSVGLETTGLPIVVMSLALFASYALGSAAASDLGVPKTTSGIYGTAVATMGMLMTAAYVLAMDTFGPIADNAGGIVEMSDAPPEVREGTDALDAAGNTTKALTKGYSAAWQHFYTFQLF